MAAPQGIRGVIAGIWGSGPQSVFAVGVGGAILHYDGHGWEQIDSPTSQALAGIWGTASGEVFAVGGECTVIRYDGKTWSKMPMPDAPTRCGLGAVWASSSRDVFAAGAGEVNDRVGVGGLLLHYDGESWKGSPDDNLFHYNDIWGSGPHDIYVVGQRPNAGVVNHFDGKAWTGVYDSSWGGDPGFPPVFGAVWGSGPRDIYFSAGNFLVHYDGQKWTKTSPGWFGSAGWASGPADVFVVADSGWVVHYDGKDWKQMASGTGANLTAIWGSGPGDVFAVGDDATILHYSCGNP